jgi:UDP-glucose 4-epimerase
VLGMRLSNQYLNEILERRSGGVATCYAYPLYAKYVLDFEVKLDLDDIFVIHGIGSHRFRMASVLKDN